ncbi:FMN-dependent NADH-azoreductase [Paenibacillus sp. UNC496MF]|uniref:NAD(P)H-dependent oxidoreductase n=1 Tax=Paenibacillus sp. UNC496MF TaxID=1502753 RepID=UPI0008E4021B|nr:NAD(P)H-dependent oxidoreductase [Paenibacillus sp. UNC496MF]SFJ68974.1 FMN-dependent NADH-azoreductase [Paenibacillus sp. UNC496MF]
MLSQLTPLFAASSAASGAPGKKVLYITANPNGVEHSYSMAVGKAFIDAYHAVNPNDAVYPIDLFQTDIPLLNGEVFGAWGKLQAGASFDRLTPSEQVKVSRLGELVDGFVEADKYVFVNPVWNFSYPPVLKAYIDAFFVAGKTFRYTADGPIGLLTDKKAFHIQASGSVLSEGHFGEFEMAHRHLGAVLKFLGVPSFEAVYVEGMAAQPDKAEDIKTQAILNAREAAKRF